MDDNHSNQEKVNTDNSYNVGDKYKVPYEGSLGLLALGHIGLKLWRETREAIDEEKKQAKANSQDKKSQAKKNKT